MTITDRRLEIIARLGHACGLPWAPECDCAPLADWAECVRLMQAVDGAR